MSDVSIVPALVTSSGFTPCPDALVKEYSHTTALIWGRIWRYSQMADGVCRASVERICDDLCLSDKTVAKHISLLESGNYVIDNTPDIRNIPHVYVDTGKLRIKISIDFDEKAGTENFRTGTEKLRMKNLLLRGAGAKSKTFAAYEENIGALTAMISETLQDAEREFSEAWILDAIMLAVKNNKRNWRYCDTILKRWKADGKDAGEGKPAPTFTDALKKAGYK
jgi:DnaD/phage-associated family protein